MVASGLKIVANSHLSAHNQIRPNKVPERKLSRLRAYFPGLQYSPILSSPNPEFHQLCYQSTYPNSFPGHNQPTPPLYTATITSAVTVRFTCILVATIEWRQGTVRRNGETETRAVRGSWDAAAGYTDYKTFRSHAGGELAALNFGFSSRLSGLHVPSALGHLNDPLDPKRGPAIAFLPRLPYPLFPKSP